MIKVLQIGCGKMSKYSMRYVYEKGAEIVGAFDINEHVIGKDIGALMETEDKGIKVDNLSNLEGFLKENKADIAIVTTRSLISELKDVVLTLVNGKVNVVTTCEEAFFAENSNKLVFDEIDSGSSSISSENPSTNNNRNSGNKKRGLEFVSSKGNAENVVNSQNSSYSGQTQQPQQTQDYDQNRQASKQKFLNFDRNGDFVSKKFLNRSYSKFELKTGHIIHGIMITGVNSDLPGQVLGQISQNVYDTVTGKHLLIPMGTKIYGTYDSNLTYGQNRLLLVWQRLVFPNGYTLELENLQGADLMGQAGFKGRVNNHFLKLLRSVLLSSAVTAATSRLDNVNVNVDTGNRSRVSIGTGASTASEKIQSIGEKLVEKDLNRQPTIYVKKGHKFNIIVNKDIILVPYNQLRR